MVNNKFRYPIFPDRTYTLVYDGYELQVSGEEIMAMFDRQARMTKLIKDWIVSPDTPDFTLFDD